MPPGSFPFGTEQEQTWQNASAETPIFLSPVRLDRSQKFALENPADRTSKTRWPPAPAHVGLKRAGSSLRLRNARSSIWAVPPFLPSVGRRAVRSEAERF